MEDFLVFDLETQRSAQDVGGWENIADMKVSVGVIWDSTTQQYHTYYEDQVQALIDHLKSGPLVIGYNHMGFDYTVLSGYYPAGAERQKAMEDFKGLKNLDLLTSLKGIIGKRIKLDSVARPTLNVGKSADGLLALQWYKEYLAGDQGKLKMIADYCQQDVQVTRDVYLYGVEKGEISYEDKVLGIKQVAVDWKSYGQEEVEEEEESVQLTF